MSPRDKRIRTKRKQETARRRKSAEFQAEHGEAEADAVGDAIVEGIRPGVNAGPLLARADSTTRARRQSAPTGAGKHVRSTRSS
jgi:hypothetical protein